MLAFDRMASLTDTSSEKQALMSDLLKYCQQDTLLMTELHRTLRDKIYSIEDKKWMVQTPKKEIKIPATHFQNT